MIRTTKTQESSNDHKEIDFKDFSQYLNDISFDEALHRVRRMSWDRVLANEFLIGEEFQETPSLMKKAVNL